ncbi:MAG: hypothetical protein A2942_02645 [Candidatus Lloydbacteria bacterium RIFCSPLOWO2_01_FULL_50_20]|uniref:Uncharacterized protein n=1 Tax=Candidatus Lloydbacteria bacterium RIFCSPLOWO2_01_FULL_50_20 TaxID=1798665 RepID=A0A1G2DE12_9BACT|nr:MAG: hypothetical protein A2942_02645 [Candidatus Lloydbacteria bacterium RIFCSPLOWO2_01_FULL_50_20]
MSKYSPSEAQRHPGTLDDFDKYTRQVLETYLAALESEDPDELKKLAHSLNVWFAYILGKDRPEGLKTKELREKLLVWIDTILAR